MSIGGVDAIERSVHKTNEWVKGMGEALGTDDRDSAWRLLRASLQVLRDQLTIDEAAQLSAQLPMVLRGAFWDGFDPGDRGAKVRRREDFLARLATFARLDDVDEAARAAEAFSSVLKDHITEGEFDDVLAQLPSDVRKVLAVSS
jgi:uncharacterized protein (DUF2267 family)